jgi:signal transduction histidine kinase/CheY-like chemotaxis protein
MNQESVIQAIREILDAIQAKKPLEEVMQLILHWACTITESVHGSFVTINHADKSLRITSTYGPDWTDEIRSRQLKLGQGITGRVAATGKPYLCHDTAQDPNYITWFDYVRSEMTVPIYLQNQIWGIINLDGLKPNEYNETSLNQINLFAQLAASAIDLRLKWDLEQRLQAELLQAEKLATLGKLIAGIAHEINNPLTAILGGASVLAYEIDNPEHKETLEAIASEAQRAADLVKNLLAFSRRQSGNMQVRAINEILRDTCGLVRHQLKLKNIRLTVGVPDKSPLVKVNSLQIEQVILNLINNAEQAIEMEGRCDGNITVEVEEEQDTVTIHIIDNGIGMVTEVRESIYDPFFTTKEVGKGTGLGLSIAQGIIHAHGGKIVCSSGLHAGAVFTVRLPRADEVLSQPIPETSKKTAPFPRDLQENVSSSPRRILVVDDEEMIRSALSRFLKTQGFDVVTAQDGQIGLAIAHKENFDLVISDIRMPRMNGLEFYHGMLEVDRIYRQRFIFMTGDLISTDLISKVKETPCPCLEKPFSFDRLLDLISGERNPAAAIVA